MTTTDRAGTTRPAAAAAAEATGTAAVTTPEEALAAVRRLAPEITARAPEIEAARRVPRDLLDAVARAGGYRLLLPRSHGGLGADPVGAFRVYEALAASDASLAWVVLIGGGGWLDLTGLPPATFDELFGRGDTRMAGVFRPSGSATPVGGGYRIDGRWTFASGCEDADRLYVNCLEGVVDGEPQL
ncbi:MAG TPA: acyl-CoA dehydrogenase family protein, partial [Acidimicrobiales bacterium]